MQPIILKNIKLLSIQEVARFFKVHRSTISRYALSGELKSYMLGTRRLFKENDVLLFFEKQVARVSGISGKDR